MSDDIDQTKEKNEDTLYSKLKILISEHKKEVLTGIFILLAACIGGVAVIVAAFIERPPNNQTPTQSSGEVVNPSQTKLMETKNIRHTPVNTISLTEEDLRGTSTPTETSTPKKTSTITLEPSATSTPQSEVVENISITFGTEEIKLLEGEIIVGTADEFQQEKGKPLTAFLIKGPYEKEIIIYKGGWQKWINVFDEEFMAYLLDQKVSELVNTHDDYENRGHRTVILPTPIIFIPDICRQETDCECNWQFASIGPDFPSPMEDTFLLQNVGDDVLEIGPETSTCEECLVGWHNPANGDLVLPGGYTQFNVEYSWDLDPLRGSNHEHTITIPSNAGNCTVLTIKVPIRY